MAIHPIRVVGDPVLPLDAHPDVISADRADNTISVLLGNPDGTFQARTTFATGAGPASISVADVNRDGHLDAVTFPQH